MDKQKTIYSFIGLPASGKGTQADILANRLGLKVIGIGDMIRDAIAEGGSDPFVAEIKQRYDKGTPQPDNVAIDLVKNYLENIETDVIFDNFPFGEGQARFVVDFITKNPSWQIVTLYLELEPEMAIKRVTSRKICSVCGAIYEASDEMICDACGGSLYVRTDDNADIAKTRIEHYLPKIKEGLDFLESQKTKVLRIDGSKTVAEVSEDISKKL